MSSPTIPNSWSYSSFVSENSPLLHVLGAVGVMGIGAATYYLSSTRASTKRIQPIADLHQQTRVLSEVDGERVGSAFAAVGLLERPFDGINTLYQSFRRGARESNNGECLGYRERVGDDEWSGYKWIRYNDVIVKAENVAAGMLALDIPPGQETFIGVYSTNRPEWTITEQACYCYSMVVVPLYDTLGADACVFILNQAEIQLVLCDTTKKAESLLEKKAECAVLRVLVTVETPTPALKESAKSKGVRVMSFDELEQLGAAQKQRRPAEPPRPEDLSTICYTSGTTGTPKGAMLTHANIIADCSAFLVLKHTTVNRDDCLMSFLPLAHMFERLVETMMFMVGCKVGFFRGDIKYLADDIKELRPTVLPVVPRLLNRIYDKVVAEVNKSSLKRAIFNWAMASKTKELERSIVRNDSIWDRIVFKRVRESLGGRLRLMVTGSAPCAENILTFMRNALGCIVVEGYGQTECVACCTVTLEGDHTAGHVGPPIPCNKVKLVDVPEMNYFARNGVGELCIKGPNVFKGYYKDPEKTAEALDSEGWLHTGDVARWTESGVLKIVDRKKHIFKLAQGEYIAPEKIEIVYTRSKFVAQCFVYGESLKASLVAIVVPDIEVLQKHAAKELGLPANATLNDLCRNEAVKKLIMDDMLALGKKSGLCSFEQVKDIRLCAELFSVENGLLTPTFKSKRPALSVFFNNQIAQMYKTLA